MEPCGYFQCRQLEQDRGLAHVDAPNYSPPWRRNPAARRADSLPCTAELSPWLLCLEQPGRSGSSSSPLPVRANLA
jgi:hypothetical protein